MKKLILLSLILSALPIYGQQDTWLQMDSLNGQPRSVAASFVIDGDGWAICGLDNSGFRRKIYSYDYFQNDWDDEESLGGINGAGLNRGSASAFAINNKGYVCLGQGQTNPFFKDLWELNPATNVWTQKADFIGGPRRQAIAFAIDSLAYVGTGIDATGMRKDMYKYSASTNTWTAIADFGGTARKEAVAFTMGDQGYVGTGDDGVMRNDFWQYEPTTDSWIPKANFPGTARKGAVGWGVFPQAFICTGEDINFDYRNDLWEYNYFSNSWVQRADLPGPGRSNAIAFVLNNIAFVGTGYDGIFYDDLWAYNKTLGVQSLQDQIEISMYPNPSNNVVHLKIDMDVSISLHTIDGRDVTNNVSIVEEINGYLINRNNLPSGSYIIKISSNSIGVIKQDKIVFV